MPRLVKNSHKPFVYSCHVRTQFVHTFGVHLYPHSTQAMNRPNRHELIFFLIRGGGGGGGGFVRFRYFFFSNRDELRVIPDSDTMSLRIFGRIGSIRLESRKNSLRLENNIRTCCTKVKESITNQLRICRMQHELGTN